jgi:hypothetical protein
VLRASRCCKESWRPRQHYRRTAFATSALLIRRAVALLTIYSFLPVPSNALAFLQIQVLEGEGAVHGTGLRAAKPLVIQVTDETGRPVGGAAVSFRMPEEGPGGVFGEGLHTEITTTGPDGRAMAYGMRWNTTPGPFQIRITAVKDQIRAGTVSSQYLSAEAPRAQAAGGTRSGRKWIWIAAAVGGAAAAGMLAGRAKASSTSSPAPPATPPQIGTPTISIGKP